MEPRLVREMKAAPWLETSGSTTKGVCAVNVWRMGKLNCWAQKPKENTKSRDIIHVKQHSVSMFWHVKFVRPNTQVRQQKQHKNATMATEARWRGARRGWGPISTTMKWKWVSMSILILMKSWSFASWQYWKCQSRCPREQDKTWQTRSWHPEQVNDNGAPWRYEPQGGDQQEDGTWAVSPNSFFLLQRTNIPFWV